MQRMGAAARAAHAIAALLLLSSGVAFRYNLDDEFLTTSRASYSEGWMFGSNKGPHGAPQGPSYVHADLDIMAIPVRDPGTSFNISMMFYRSFSLDFGIESNFNICPERPVLPASFLDVQVVSFPVHATDGEEDGKQAYTANVVAHRDVDESGLQHAFIQVCPTSVDTMALFVEGELTFRNPYGYLPGMDFGALPFELFRVLASIALGVFFGYAMWRHRANVLPVHKMILGVVVLGTLEALSWLTAYSYMNRTGKPYCCPYPGTVILAMVMEVLRRTTSRFMLLMICLGFGITRVQLEKREMLCVGSLTIAFLASGVLQLASSVASASHVRNGDRYGGFDPMLAIPALLTDIVFLTWIYGTLANMIKELKDLNETYKLKMYKALAWTLGTFVTLFTTLTVAMLAAEGSPEQSWEWKWEWVQVVSWEILNFCMLVAVSIIWLPSPRSAMLAYSKQLATTEVGAEHADGIEMDGVEMQGPGAVGHFTIGEDGGSSDEEHSEDGKADEGGGDRGRGMVYSLSDIEPQRHMDLT